VHDTTYEALRFQTFIENLRKATSGTNEK
jgi:hypothetical protein